MAGVNQTIQQLLLSLATITVIAHSATTTHLQFYMHDTVTPSAGSPATAVRAVRGPTPAPGNPINRFGDMYVIDDVLTEGADAASRAVGRAQGFYLMASRSAGPAAVLGQRGVYGREAQREFRRRDGQGRHPRRGQGAPRCWGHRQVPWRRRVRPDPDALLQRQQQQRRAQG
ncbi:hypothetical protein PVAP13_8KG163300 [Panicum virgatum]|uniref:Dirigent protein n=1 Tax=Panicum virgatum TaxID=38727 RepID=A0A8T0PML8_PANVG|nr:hypothetical protein PVAP13_8KG163300 [Panicum virgatum]